jgi:hypothetical protein
MAIANRLSAYVLVNLKIAKPLTYIWQGVL